MDAKAGLSMIQSRVMRTLSGDKVFWGPKREQNKTQKPTSASLLADFDEYVVAYKDRSAVFTTDDQLKMPDGTLGRTVIFDGRIVGTWKQTNEKGLVKISVRPYRPLKKSETLAIAAAADRYAKFLGTDIKPLLMYGKL